MAKALIASITSQRRQPINLMELTGQKIRSKRPSVPYQYVPPSMREMHENNTALPSEKLSVFSMSPIEQVMMSKKLDNHRSSRHSGSQSPPRKCAFASRESNRCERGNAAHSWRTPSPPRHSVVPANNPWNQPQPQPAQRVARSAPVTPCVLIPVQRPSDLSQVNLQQRAVYRLPAPGARNNQGIQRSWRRQSTNSVKSNESFEG